MEALRNARAIDPADPRIGELTRALAQTQAAPPSAAAAFARANQLRDARRFAEAEAEAAYRYALRLDPAHAAAHNNLGILLAMRGETDEAARQFEDVLRLDPNDATAHFNLGALLAKQGKFDDAIPHFERAIAIQPGYDAAR
jgi:tetratricopeptide (TPR) repeat protein